jgi:nucleotide-binding universal stress UspA family protein
MSSVPGPIQSIFHPSDFSAGSEVAFMHALRIALSTRSTLSVLHADSSNQSNWSDFPGVRSTLERWRLLPPGSPKSAVVDLGIDVVKVLAPERNPVRASLNFLSRHRADLIVVAIHQYEGHMRWLAKRVGEPVARAAGETTLFIPYGIEGFVSGADGSLSLESILVPIASAPRAQPAVDAVARLIQGFQLPAGTVTLLHVGAVADAPVVTVPDNGWTWSRLTVDGEPAEAIVRTAGEIGADLIVMTSRGPDGFLDGLRGSTSERVLRRTPCPVANVPST